MSDLYPTKTRLALLQSVAAGVVVDLPDEEQNTIVTFDTTGAEHGEPARRVTARIDEFVRAGWVCINLDGMGWQLTDAGAAVLASSKADR